MVDLSAEPMLPSTKHQVDSVQIQQMFADGAGLMDLVYLDQWIQQLTPPTEPARQLECSGV